MHAEEYILILSLYKVIIFEGVLIATFARLTHTVQYY